MQYYSRVVFIIAVFAVLITSCGPNNKELAIENDQVSDKLKNAVDTTWIKLNEKIKQDPSNLDLFHQRAKYLFEKGEIKGAIADVRRIIKVDSTHSEYYLTLAELLLTTGNGGGVKQALEKCIQLDPKNIEGRLKMAELQLFLENYKECLRQLDEALKLDKYQAKAYFIKGMAFKEIGDTAKAVSSFQTTVEQDPEYYHAYMQLGLLYATEHNKFAIDYYKNAIKTNPKSIEAYYGLGMFYQENNMPELAIGAYDAILRIDSTYQNAHFNKGYVYSEYLSDYKMAVEHYTNAIKYAPAYIDAYYQRGFAYERMKDKKKAEADYQEALKINGSYTLAAKGLNRIIG